MSSSAVHSAFVGLGEKVSLVTVKRTLSQMAKADWIRVSGSGPATTYEISSLGRLFASINAHEYCAAEPDKRFGLANFNFDLLPALPMEIFSSDELNVLERASAEYRRRTSDISDAIQHKELERLVIELSWKSSQIEGNTYTLLDTEKLILKNKEAPGHDKQEARMILNHKDAFALIHDKRRQFKTLTRANLEQLHAALVKDLSINIGVRTQPFGFLGSKCRPLDNRHQITDAIQSLATAIARAETAYAKALIALFGISYIQPFEDGNKRTARLMANALLLAHGCAPLSYRSVDENEYREAVLVFYEINSIVPSKKIFVEQYDFAARNYAVK